MPTDKGKAGDFPGQNNLPSVLRAASKGGLRVPVAREIPGGRVRTSRKCEQRTCPSGIQPEDPAHRDPANFILCIAVHHRFKVFSKIWTPTSSLPSLQ